MSHKERCSHGIYGHFALTLIVHVFESQTLGYKPNSVSHEKSPKLLCQILKKSFGLWVKKYST